LLVGEVIHQKAAVGAPIESSAQRLVALLASSIPNLKSDDAPRGGADLLVAEISPDGGLEAFGELGVFEHLDERGLANT